MSDEPEYYLYNVNVSQYFLTKINAGVIDEKKKFDFKHGAILDAIKDVMLNDSKKIKRFQCNKTGKIFTWVCWRLVCSKLYLFRLSRTTYFSVVKDLIEQGVLEKRNVAEENRVYYTQGRRFHELTNRCGSSTVGLTTEKPVTSKSNGEDSPDITPPYKKISPGGAGFPRPGDLSHVTTSREGDQTDGVSGQSIEIHNPAGGTSIPPSGDLPKNKVNEATKKASTPATVSGWNLPKPDDIETSLWEDFLAHRKAKKSPITGRVIEIFRREATMAGISLSEAIEETIYRGWQGFKAEWYLGNNNKQNFRIKQKIVSEI